MQWAFSLLNPVRPPCPLEHSLVDTGVFHLEPAAIRMRLTDMDEPIPPIEYEPPYSLDFLAHLHGECYDGTHDLSQVWASVLRDASAAQIVRELTEVQMALRGFSARRTHP